MKPLANDFVEIYRSPDPQNVYACTPAIWVLDSGRYIFTNDLIGPNAPAQPQFQQLNQLGSKMRCGQIYTSDDKGKTWQYRCARSFFHARPFAAGGHVYILGHCDNLVIYRSDDDGETWDEGHFLTEGELWHQSACNVWIEGGYVNLVMEIHYRLPEEVPGGWPVADMAPVVMRAKVDADLTKRESWTFSNRVRFRELVNEDELDMHGIPFYHSKKHVKDFPAGTFLTEMPGWLETNIVRITDPAHYWYDESGKTFHLFMRAHTAGSGYCCMMKAVITEEDGKEVITVQPERNPSGRRVIYLPMPGGQMRFHILWDEETKLYWLLSTQATDTMRRRELLSDERYNIPCDERDRMQLSFSKNMVDWCFAGLVAKGDSEKQSRHYACMAIDGEDLVIVSRSGDKDTLSAHNTNLSTFHRVKDFRKLVY